MAMDEVQTRVFGIDPLFYFIFFYFCPGKKKEWRRWDEIGAVGGGLKIEDVREIGSFF